LIKGFCYYLLYQSMLRFLPNRFLLASIKRVKQKSDRTTKLSFEQALEIFEILNWRLAGMQACLCRSFVAYQIFAAYSAEIKFCYGVSTDQTDLLAHSWVETTTGQVLSDALSQKHRFSEILSI
jgi:hypothetical protein